MNKIIDPWISKVPFENVNKISEKLDYSDWIAYIENHEYFTWFEDTAMGKALAANIDKVPEKFKTKVLIHLNKTEAYFNYFRKSSKYAFIVNFNIELGLISTTFMHSAKKGELMELLTMAEYLGVY